MIALPARDEDVSLRFTAIHPMLSRQFDRRLDRLGPTGKEQYALEARAFDESGRQRFGGTTREERRMRERHLARLAPDSGNDAFFAVAEDRDRRSSTGVEETPALGIDQVHAFAADRTRVVGIEAAMDEPGQPSALRGMR